MTNDTIEDGKTMHSENHSQMELHLQEQHTMDSVLQRLLLDRETPSTTEQQILSVVTQIRDWLQAHDNPLPGDDMLWDVKQVAQYWHLGENAARRALRVSGAPRAVKMPTGKDTHTQALYRPEQIRAYTLKHQLKRAGLK